MTFQMFVNWCETLVLRVRAESVGLRRDGITSYGFLKQGKILGKVDSSSVAQ